MSYARNDSCDTPSGPWHDTSHQITRWHKGYWSPFFFATFFLAAETLGRLMTQQQLVFPLFVRQLRVQSPMQSTSNAGYVTRVVQKKVQLLFHQLCFCFPSHLCYRYLPEFIFRNTPAVAWFSLSYRCSLNSFNRIRRIQITGCSIRAGNT